MIVTSQSTVTGERHRTGNKASFQPAILSLESASGGCLGALLQFFMHVVAIVGQFVDSVNQAFALAN
jgi:hypothetical protein